MFARLVTIARHSTGMLMVGGLCWLAYLPFVNVLRLYFGWPHLAAEALGIVISHQAYYFANLYFVFRQRPSWRGYRASLLISGGGWLGYMLFQWVVTDALNLYASWTEIAGIPLNAGLNLVFQQWWTFGKLARPVGARQAAPIRAARGM